MLIKIFMLFSTEVCDKCLSPSSYMKISFLPSRYVQDQMFYDKVLHKNKTIKNTLKNCTEICTHALFKHISLSKEKNINAFII